MTDQTPLRDRIAAALYERERPPREPHWNKAFPADREVFEAMADAVLAGVPVLADRTAVLREAADEIAGIDFHPNARARSLDVAAGLARRLRRMADETAATETQAHPPLHQWRVEILDGDEWMPASGLRRDRSQAAEQLRMSSERRPLWNDGTRVQRRLVRETTTYTVEDETGHAAGARQDGAQP
ncbi:hypothetical protein ACIQ6R_06250 [Streptomyces sp. NPDC096048]|uniref:hypothetical protein n=1 Tax=Streptomyces sp. NPDC096048 TaxID=3366072 RepID=UPI00381C8DC4